MPASKPSRRGQRGSIHAGIRHAFAGRNFKPDTWSGSRLTNARIRRKLALVRAPVTARLPLYSGTSKYAPLRQGYGIPTPLPLRREQGELGQGRVQAARQRCSDALTKTGWNPGTTALDQLMASARGRDFAGSCFCPGSNSYPSCPMMGCPRERPSKLTARGYPENFIRAPQGS